MQKLQRTTKRSHRAYTKAHETFVLSPSLPSNTPIVSMTEAEQAFNRHIRLPTNKTQWDEGGKRVRVEAIRYTTTFHQYSFVCNFLFAKHVIYFIKRKSSFHPVLPSRSHQQSFRISSLVQQRVQVASHTPRNIIDGSVVDCHEYVCAWKEEEKLSKNPFSPE